MNFNKLIKKLKAEKPKDKEEAREMKENIRAFTMLEKIKRRKVKTRVDFNKAFSVLCFESIAFCCGKSNPCLLRNGVLDSLGISLKEYTKMKKKWDKEFIENFIRKRQI